jgi:hypothetical protein
MNFKFAAITGAGIDFPDRNTTPKAPTGGTMQARREFG